MLCIQYSTTLLFLTRIKFARDRKYRLSIVFVRFHNIESRIVLVLGTEILLLFAIVCESTEIAEAHTHGCTCSHDTAHTCQ